MSFLFSFFRFCLAVDQTRKNRIYSLIESEVKIILSIYSLYVLFFMIYIHVSEEYLPKHDDIFERVKKTKTMQPHIQISRADT